MSLPVGEANWDDIRKWELDTAEFLFSKAHILPGASVKFERARMTALKIYLGTLLACLKDILKDLG